MQCKGIGTKMRNTQKREMMECIASRHWTHEEVRAVLTVTKSDRHCENR